MSEFDRDTGEVIEAAPQVPALAVMRPLASPEVMEVCAALAAAQAEMDPPQRTKKGKIEGTSRSGRDYSFEYSYAPLEEIIRVVRKPFADHGLARQQYIVTRGGGWFLRTILWHTSGQWLSSDYPIFAEQMTGQKFAGAVTYAKRQGLCLVAGIAPEDDNDLQEQAEAPQAKAVQQRATRANPAAAPADPRRDEAAAAYRRMQKAIDSATYPDALFDPEELPGEQWAPDVRDDIALIAAVSPASVNALRDRLQARLNSAPHA